MASLAPIIYLVVMEKHAENTMRVLGMMTGTSADGLDLCLVEFRGEGTTPAFEIINTLDIDYPTKFKVAFRDPLELSEEQVSDLDTELGQWFAHELVKLDLSYDLIGSHGQTLRHEPPYFTLQIGDPSFMAKQLNTPVVYDFRSRDVELGGQGAPLIPIVDQFLYTRDDEDVICLNIGGISNITILPSKQKQLPIIAWDTGPGNTLIDKAVRLYSNYKLSFDRDGQLAAEGQLNEGWLKLLLSHEFYDLNPPKSAGQEQFGKTYFDELLKQTYPRTDQEFKDLILCFTLLTAKTIANSIKTVSEDYNPTTIYVSGGGAKNKTLLSQLKNELPQLKIGFAERDGITTDNKEAFGFAYLAYLRMMNMPGNIPKVTGASEHAILGKIYWP